jgi:hypothetical protein
MTRSQLVGNLRSNTLNHFPSITALTANSLPFVIDEWTVAHPVSPDSQPMSGSSALPSSRVVRILLS